MKKLIFCILIAIMAVSLVACRSGPPNEVHTLEDVDGKVIGALSGTPSARLAEELGTARSLYSGDELMYALTSGTVDCALLESTMATELVSGSSGTRILSETLTEYELRFAVPRENSQLLEVVNSALEALEANGVLRNLRDKYLSGRNYTYVPPTGIEPRPGELTLAVSLDSPPFSYKEANGECAGLDVEVAQAICDYLGVELSIIEEEVSELVTAVWYGRASLAAGWLPGDIDEQVSISEPYASTAYVVVVRR